MWSRKNMRLRSIARTLNCPYSRVCITCGRRQKETREKKKER